MRARCEREHGEEEESGEAFHVAVPFVLCVTVGMTHKRDVVLVDRPAVTIDERFKVNVDVSVVAPAADVFARAIIHDTVQGSAARRMRRFSLSTPNGRRSTIAGGSRAYSWVASHRGYAQTC